MELDEKTIEGIKFGDYTCFNRLFLYYYRKLCSYVAEITKDDIASEDIVQELFTKLWANREKIEIRENIGPYLFRSSKNASLNYLRDRSSQKNILESIPVNISQPADDLIEYHEFLSILDDCIDQLPPRSKEVFCLNRFNGLKNKEISEKLNISVKTIKNQLWKSLQIIKSCLEKKDAF